MKKLIIGLLALLVIVPAAQAAEVVLRAHDWDSPSSNDFGATKYLVGQGMGAIASSRHDMNRIQRGTYSFNVSSLAGDTIDSATMIVSCSYYLSNTGHYGAEAPGVYAYSIDLTNGDTGVISEDDWDAAMVTDLGWVIPPGVGDYYDDPAVAKDWTIDVASALQDHLDNSGETFFGVRFHIGNELDGIPILTGWLKYPFEWRAVPEPPRSSDPRLEVTFTDGGDTEPNPYAYVSGSFRIMVEFDTGTPPISNNPVFLDVYFHRIIRDMGVNGTVDLDSVRVVEYDKATGTPKVYNPAAPGDKKYEIPFRCFSPAEQVQVAIAVPVGGPGCRHCSGR